MRRSEWDQFETDGEGDEEISETVLNAIRESGPEWDVLGVDIADETDEGVLFLLVMRRRVSDEGNLILSERYYRYDLEEREGSYLSNGIERRMTGAMSAALRVLYAATTNGDVDPDDPMLIDSRGDGLSYNPSELVEPLEDEDEDELAEDDPVALDEPERESWVRCKRCGETLRKDDATQFSSGPPLGDIWIHSDGCPDTEGDA